MEEIEARLAPGRIPLVEIGVLVVTTGLLWSLCLPPMPLYLPDIEQLSTVFHPQWLVLATLLALPLARVAAWRYWVGLLALVICSALSLAITDEAVDRARAAGLDLGGTESVWMALAGVQVAIFAFASLKGFRKRRFVRRWQRLDRKLAANAPSPTRRSSPR